MYYRVILTKISGFVKGFLKENLYDIIMFIMVLLLIMLSFAVGFITAKYQGKQPIQIETHENT
jgi:UPF0716 family protein affecting phage T7 exclusion